MPRIQKINKNVKKTNKKVCTDENNSKGKMKIQSFPVDNVKGKKNSKSKEKNKKKEEMKKSLSTIDSSKGLLQQIEVTNNLKLLLQQKISELEKLKSDKINEINNINNDIIEKNIKIDSMTKNTTLLLNKLTYMSKDVDSQYSKYNIDLEIEKQRSKITLDKNEYENNLKNNISHGKSSIKHNNNIIDMLKIQKEKLEKIIKEENDEKINEYKKYLENLIKKENKIKNDIVILKNIKFKHINLCHKKKENLIKLLKMAQSEYDYEVKKIGKNFILKTNKKNDSFINYNSLDDKNKIRVIKPIKIVNNKIYKSKSNSFISDENPQLPKINKNKIKIIFNDSDNNTNNNINEENNNSVEKSNKSLFYKKHSDIFNKMNQKALSDKNILKSPIPVESIKHRNIPNKTKSYIEKDLFELKKQIILSKQLKYKPFLNKYTNNSLLSKINININNNGCNNISSINDYNKTNNSRFLFSDTEMNFLSRVVPNECLEKYQEKFNNIEEQRLILKEKLKDNITQKMVNSHQSNEIDFTELQKKTCNYIMIKLHSKLSEIKKNINDIKIENKNVYNKYKEIQKKYRKRKNENDKLMKYFQDLYNDIKNNKIKLIKGQKLNQDEKNAINKWTESNEHFIIQNNQIDNEEKNDNDDENQNISDNEEKEEENEEAELDRDNEDDDN